MRVLLTTSIWTETYGHIIRSLAVAEELLGQDHEVGLLGHESYRDLVPEGVHFYAYNNKPPHIRESGIFFGFHTYEDVIYACGHTDEDHLLHTVERERGVIADFRPDVIFNDLQFTAGISARLAKVPMASIVTWPVHPMFNKHIEKELPERNILLRRIRNHWNSVLRHYHLPVIGHVSEMLFAYSSALIAPTSPLLEPELADPAMHIQFVGHLAPQAFAKVPSWLKDWEQQSDDRPFAYIYLSSLPIGINAKANFEALVQALGQCELRTVLAIGQFNPEVTAETFQHGFDHVRIVPFVPGEAMMSRSRLAVYPATHNMMVSAAKHRVPSIVFPDMFERSYNARCLQRIGLGRIGQEQDLRPDRLVALIEEILTLDLSSDETNQVNRHLLGLNGPADVVRKLELLALSNRQKFQSHP